LRVEKPDHQTIVAVEVSTQSRSDAESTLLDWQEAVRDL